MLTPEDIAAFHRDGFACVENILDEGEIARLRQAQGLRPSRRMDSPGRNPGLGAHGRHQPDALLNALHF